MIMPRAHDRMEMDVTVETVALDLDALERKYAEERGKRLRQDASRQYQELNGKFADFDRDPFADPNFTRDPIVKDVDVMIIGGGQIYAEAMHLADQQILTEIHQSPEGDTFYPPFDATEWAETKRESYDGYDFVWLDRIFLG